MRKKRFLDSHKRQIMNKNDERKNDKRTECTNLEKTHVHQVYDKFGSVFADYRSQPWPGVVQFLNSLEVGSVVADVGESI